MPKMTDAEIIASQLAHQATASEIEIIGLSMRPTLRAGDRLHRQPDPSQDPYEAPNTQPGEIICTTAPTHDMLYVRYCGNDTPAHARSTCKRLIAGRAGDKITANAHGIAVNGRRWPREPAPDPDPAWTATQPDLANARCYREQAPNGSWHLILDHGDPAAESHDTAWWGSWTLGDGEIFVLGDNRIMSADSRNEFIPGGANAMRREFLDPGRIQRIERGYEPSLETRPWDTHDDTGPDATLA